MSKKRFTGFGFGPIQAGLMMYEAMRSGNFDKYTIVEIDRNLVDMIRANHNSIAINIANKCSIETVKLDDFEILNPEDPADIPLIEKAIFNADELATAIPSVKYYDSGKTSSIARLLATNINPDKSQILYASENDNYAAEILTECILKHTSASRLANFHILNTVIGKMSGFAQTHEDIRRLGLEPIVPGYAKAVLVEAFNTIYISKLPVPAKHGIPVFQEKEDLLPFEEAKLYGHNAIHSLLAYNAFVKGYRFMSEAGKDADLMRLARQAFIKESGKALISKYSTLNDTLFTPDGFKSYAEDLLSRMTNEFLHDEVARVIRDPIRKLGYSDRIFGTMRLALDQGITPVLMAETAVLALRYALQSGCIPGHPAHEPLTANVAAGILLMIWKDVGVDQHREKVIELICSRVGEPDTVLVLDLQNAACKAVAQ